MQGETWNSNNSNGTAWRNIKQEQQQWNSRERHETGRTELEQQGETWNRNNSTRTAGRYMKQEQHKWNSRERHGTGTNST